MYGDDRAAETKKVESDGSLFGFQKCEYNRIAVAQMVAIRTDLLEEIGVEEPTTFEAVSYTHLDVYKRQEERSKTGSREKESHRH